MIDLQTVFNTAVLLHESGRPEDAIRLYEQVRTANPENGRLLYLLGTAYYQSGQLGVALDFLAQATRISPRNASAHNNLGNALKDLERPQEALASYEMALALKPDYAEAYCNRGLVLKDLARLEESVASFDRAIALRPEFGQAYCSRAAALLDLGRAEAALASCDTAIALRPDHAPAYYNRGNALLDLKRHEEALSCYDKAIALNPAAAEAFSNRALALKDLGRLEEAVASCDRAIALKPDYAEAYSHRGVVLWALWLFEEALASYDTAIALEPDYAMAYCNRGRVFYEIRQMEKARVDFERAIALKPDYAEALNNYGNVLKDLDRGEEALACYDRAIALKPDYAPAYSNRGTTFHGLGRIEAALADYDRAIAIEPDHASAHWNKSLSLILTGDYLAGWALYEWRLNKANAGDNYYNFSQPAWRGEAGIEGLKLFIWAEQGAGDVIQFCRYLPLLERFGAELIFLVPEALSALVSSLRCEMRVVEKGFLPPPFDRHCPLMSLPFALKTTLETVPAAVPYLFSEPEKRRRWGQRLGSPTRLRIGLAWSGSPTHLNDRNRSIRLAALLSWLDLPFEFHSLQPAYRDEDFETLVQYPQIQRHESALSDFSETAALIEMMDLVISVDTSIAHLAGALGKPLWILLPLAPDYRWLLEREDSPWYPGARLFRQQVAGVWEDVIREIRDLLWRFPALSGSGKPRSSAHR